MYVGSMKLAGSQRTVHDWRAPLSRDDEFVLAGVHPRSGERRRRREEITEGTISIKVGVTSRSMILPFVLWYCIGLDFGVVRLM